MQYFYFRHARQAISELTNLKQAAVYRKQKKQHIVTAQHTTFGANRHETMHIYAPLKPDK